MKTRAFNRFSTKFRNTWLWFGFAALALAAFLMLTAEVQEAARGETELIDELDRFAQRFLLDLRAPKLNSMAMEVTSLGSATVVSIVVFTGAILLLLNQKRIATVQLLVASIGSSVIALFLKPIFERARPLELHHLVEVKNFSYPSGHSLGSAAVYFTFAILICEGLAKWSQRWTVVLVFFAIIFLVGLSRVYLGVHYFSDVVAGILVGVGWASLVGGVRSVFDIQRD